jgi:hypothetical protein
MAGEEYDCEKLGCGNERGILDELVCGRRDKSVTGEK